MIEWDLATEIDQASWDNFLLRLEPNFYQSYNYGEYQRALGWQVARFLAKNEKGETIGLLQTFFKKLPFRIGLFFAVGGPIGAIQSWNRILNRKNRKALGLTLVFVRIFPHTIWKQEDEKWLLDHNWKKVPYSISTGLSIIMDISGELEDIKKNLSRQWRRSLKKAENNNLTLEVNKQVDLEEMLAVFHEMEKRKSLDTIVNKPQIEAIFNYFKNDYLLLTCRDASNQLIAVRFVCCFGTRAFDYLAASNSRARETSASYLMLWEIIRQLKKKGIEDYDLGGIDPINGKGVYRFKTGLCKNEVKYLGEYDWSNWSPFSTLVSKSWELRNKIRANR